ncbi:MAG: tryptophan synthase subunit alpha [Alphaproteobacteria bacterium]
MKRIPDTFHRLKNENRAAFVPYIMAGDPDLATTERLLGVLADLGCDAIELGMPFSDPVADGPVIQAAGLRALKHPPSFSDIFAMIRRFRQSHPHVPLVLMGYANPVYRYGTEMFCHEASHAGVDAMLLVDVPLEETEAFTHPALPLVPLITPLTPKNRQAAIVASCHPDSFVYLVGRVGITGNATVLSDTLKDLYKTVKKQSPVPVVLGFGIKTPHDIAHVAAFADGVVMGSAFVDLCARTQPLFTGATLHPDVESFVFACCKATHLFPEKG